MEKHLFLTLLFFIASLASIHAQDDVYVSPENTPDGIKFLVPPPDPYSAAFYNDYYYYGWGKEQRQDPEREQLAYDDYFDAIYHESGIHLYEEYFGMKIDEHATPALYGLLRRSVNSCSIAMDQSKQHFMRNRPFVTFGEKSLVEERGESDDYVYGTYSYPSGHTFAAYTIALLLIEINPAAANEIMNRARIYGESRIVCGHHYKSDVDAGVIMACSLVAALHSSEEFLKDMVAAKSEFKKTVTSVSSVKSDMGNAGQSTMIYSIHGAPATSNDNIVVSQGKKTITQK